MIHFLFFMVSFYPINLCTALIDIEASSQSFVLESKKIEVPGFPNAFNPSIVRFDGQLYMSFRTILGECRSSCVAGYASRIGIVRLNDEFEPVGKPTLLDLGGTYGNPALSFNAEDARLLSLGGRLLIIFSDTIGSTLDWGSWRVFVAELNCSGDSFVVSGMEAITSFPGASPFRREKNWVPFDYHGHLLFSYSLSPHRVFFLKRGEGACEEVYSSDPDIYWNLGELRGGTPALLLDSERYLAFFHSSKPMQSVHSQGCTIPHYFFGAYTFSSKPPFHILSISPEPIIGQGFYSGPDYKPYWHPVRVVFPCGFLMDEEFVSVFFGKQDHECWVVKLHKAKLLNSLRTLQNYR